MGLKGLSSRVFIAQPHCNTNSVFGDFQMTRVLYLLHTFIYHIHYLSLCTGDVGIFGNPHPCKPLCRGCRLDFSNPNRCHHFVWASGVSYPTACLLVCTGFAKGSSNPDAASNLYWTALCPVRQHSRPVTTRFGLVTEDNLDDFMVAKWPSLGCVVCGF
jgi:hypothetical protein